MARLHHLEKSLTGLFKVPSATKPDTQRRQRECAKALATSHGIEIEKLSEGGMNVWPPKGVAEASDPFSGDHYAEDWAAALGMVQEYAKMATQPTAV